MVFAAALLLLVAVSSVYLVHQWYTHELQEPRS